MIKLFAFIITHNNGNSIAKTLISLKSIAKEIIVIDSGSSDKTTLIASNLGAKVIFNAPYNLLTQKFSVENLCQNDWIINIETNEELSNELQDEIEFIFASNIQDNYLGYQIKSIALHCHEQKVRLLAPYAQYLRIYNRKYSTFAFAGNSSFRYSSVLFKANINTENKIYNLNGVIYQRFWRCFSKCVNF